MSVCVVGQTASYVEIQYIEWLPSSPYTFLTVEYGSRLFPIYKQCYDAHQRRQEDEGQQGAHQVKGSLKQALQAVHTILDGRVHLYPLCHSLCAVGMVRLYICIMCSVK